LYLTLNQILGLEAKKIYEEALIFIKKIIDEKLFTAKGIVGIYPGIYFLLLFFYIIFFFKKKLYSSF
jgi:hypothetical protein